MTALFGETEENPRKSPTCQSVHRGDTQHCGEYNHITAILHRMTQKG